ncbi:hypothetical protein D3C73_1602430 [compost metagenome]
MADHHVAVFDLGLVCRQALAGLEVEGDHRPLLHQVVHHQGQPDQHRNDGYDPHQRNTPAAGLDVGFAGLRLPLSGFRFHP